MVFKSSFKFFIFLNVKSSKTITMTPNKVILLDFALTTYLLGSLWDYLFLFCYGNIITAWTVVLTCMSGMEAASSVKVLPSERVCCLLATDPCPTPVDGKRKENLRLVGDAGLMGAEGGWSPPTPKSFIDRAASSLAIAIAQSSVFSSAAEIGFT